MALTGKNAFTVKVSSPRIEGILPRERLFQLLDAHRKYPVAWLSGPAGSGKTTLVASYLLDRKLPALWYSVDAGDSDIASFFYYMGLAVKKAAPRFRKPMPLLTPEYLMGISVFAQRFFEEFYRRIAGSPPAHRLKSSARAGRSHFVIVFDNYQLVPPESRFHEIINTGLSLAPEGISAIVISRNEPAPVFIRLRASNRMGLIGWREIRLTEDESRELVLLKEERRLTEETLSVLHKKTEGWMAGLVLLIASSKISGMDYDLLDKLTPSEIFDYFANEIFLKSDRKVQEFLLKSSFLHSMTAQSAEMLTGIKTAAKILSELEKNHYFIERRLKENPVYTYHRLFREFLVSRSKELFTSAEITRIRHKAAALVMESGLVEEAAELLLDAGDWQEFVPFVLNQAKTLWGQGRIQTLRAWLTAIPSEITEKVPWLSYWLGICQMGTDPAGSRNHLEKAFRLFEAQRNDAGAFLSWSGAVQTFLFEFDDFRPLDKWIGWLDERSNREIAYPSPEIAAGMASGMTGALAWRMPSHPHVRKWVNTAVSLCDENLNIDTRLRACTNSAIFYIWMGDFAECRILIEQMKKMVQSQPGSPARQIVLRIAEAMFYNSSVEWQAQAGRAVAEGLEISQKSGVHVMDTLLYLQGAASALNAGDKAGAHEYLVKMEKTIGVSRRAHSAHYFYFLSWYFVLANDIPQAAASAKESLRFIEEAGLPVSEALIRLTLALVLYQSGDRERACRQLQAATKISARTGSAYCAYLCDMASAYFSLSANHRATFAGSASPPTDTAGAAARPAKEGLKHLQRALVTGRQKGYVTMVHFWRPDVVSYLCIRALEAGIEVEYVQHLIRKLRLPPPAFPYETPPFDKTPSSPPLDKGGLGGILIDRWPWPVRISTLGTFELLINGKTVRSTGKTQKRPLLLLKALIAMGAKDVREEQLADILWPYAEGDAGHNAIKTTVIRLRRLIGSDAAIQVREGRVSLDHRYCWIDSLAFEQLCSQAEQILKTTASLTDSRDEILAPAAPPTGSEGENAHLLQIVSRALSLYGGPFLHSETDQTWTVAARERLRSRYLRLIARMARLSERSGNSHEAAEYYLKGLETEPLAEEFYQGLMAAYIRLGRQADGLLAYKRCKETLKAELGVAPSARTEALRAEILKTTHS